MKVAALLLAGAVIVHAAGAGAAPDPAAAMLARYAAMKDDPGRSQFHRPLHLDSTEGASAVAGEINAVVDHPFSTAGAALGTPAHWCDVMILHLNTKYCRPSGDGRQERLQVMIGKKFDQSVDQAYRVDFAWRVEARTEDYLRVRLEAREGPLGTRDYRIVLEATPAGAGRTLIRLSYSYNYGAVGKLAIQAYLGTAGRHKVGFTLTGVQADGKPLYVGGMRGVVERNTMRYFLAIEAFLGSLSSPPHARLDKSLHAWFAGSERYALQLHEMDEREYIAMKRREYSRANTPSPGPAGRVGE